MKKEPDFVCEDCNRACFITESGYAGGIDYVPINCDCCKKKLGDYQTSKFTDEKWMDWNRA